MKNVLDEDVPILSIWIRFHVNKLILICAKFHIIVTTYSRTIPLNILCIPNTHTEKINSKYIFDTVTNY